MEYLKGISPVPDQNSIASTNQFGVTLGGQKGSNGDITPAISNEKQ